MKLLILSDLHIEFSAFEHRVGQQNFDVVVLAGDIHTPGRRAVPWARKTFGHATPIVFVPGNHEYYHSDRTAELHAMRDAAAGTNVKLLDRDVFEMDGVRFLGCTLWTDFSLPFSLADGDPVAANVVIATEQAQKWMNDFRVIRNAGKAWLAEHARGQHHIDRAWLLSELSQPFEGPTVIVTHHAPCEASVQARYLHDSITPAFCTEMPVEFFGKAALWIHGHMHSSADYVHHGTRVVCNPRGYLMQDGGYENTKFNSHLVIEV